MILIRQFLRTTVRGWFCFILVLSPHLRGEEAYQQEPINYDHGPAVDVVSEYFNNPANLATWQKPGRTNYLEDFLKAFDIPIESQVLVFSKTSLQAARISPNNPRAIYFNDDIYVGWVPGGGRLEVSVPSPRTGTNFYTIGDAQGRPELIRETDSCLRCHGGTFTREVPGHLVRSVLTTAKGDPIYAAGTTLVDQATPLEKRWGGWFVTGGQGILHQGNKVFRESSREAELDHELDIRDLPNRGYSAETSDIVALMVLEHQAQAHTLIANVSIQTQLALYQQKAIDRRLNRTEPISESTRSRIKNAVDSLLRYLFFTNEVEIPRIDVTTSAFGGVFEQRGRKDKKGRSLYQLKMDQRMFEYPLSYLIYSQAVAELPAEAQDYLWPEVKRILESPVEERDYKNLNQENKREILHILRATHPQFK